MIKVLELFAGIGACSKALERLGIEHEIVDAVEIDKYAIKSFNAIHGTNFEPQDIRDWDKDIKCDLIMHGSPCQDFSIAGRQRGGDEGSGTRSSLMYETLRIVEKLRPKYVIWENVKNILSLKHVHNWDAYAERMEELGYVNYCDVMNAIDYGIPQHRERVFTISIYCGNSILERDYRMPDKMKLDKKLADLLDERVDDKFLLSPRQLHGMSVTKYESYKLSNLLRDKNGSALCIKARFEGCPQLVKNSDGKIRKFTPKECWRLMGFDDEDFEKAAKVNSNSQLYKQAGNSIVVNVLEAILKNLIGL